MRVAADRHCKEIARRTYALLGAAVAVLAMLLILTGPARAATPAHTDVMFLFDTSGSMSSELTEAKQEMLKVMANVATKLPDVQYGVAEVRDYSPSIYDEEEPGVFPWKLDQAVTSNQEAVVKAIEPLTAFGGGDNPESYGRALWETDTNPTVGWREGAQHVIILVADDVPHDNNLNEGLPESAWVENPFETGEELPGTWNIPGTVWTPGTNMDFQTTMVKLGADGKPLEDVDFSGSSGYLPYWEYWASLSGGHATGAEAGTGALAAKVTELIETGATTALPACPVGEARNSAGICVPKHPTVSQVICNLTIATATDTCTATVGDAATSGQINPTGTVSFTSAHGGVFSAGNTCTLTPSPGTTSSCSVQFIPPTASSSLPAITASYAGDAYHEPSSAQTHYAPLSDLAKEVDWSEVGTIKPDGSVEIPVDCGGFPCALSGELLGGPDLASLTTFSGGSATISATLAGSKGKHKSKKKKKPAVLGKGKLKLSKGGKGNLVIKLSSKARHALKKAGSKGARVTLKVTIKTLTGSLVGTETKHIKLRPQRAKKKAHGKHH
ncbi:MAG: vWA domain-containing protein [Solirubrobacteraceae bacterium]